MKAFGWFVVFAGFGPLVWAACGGDDDDGGGGGGEDRVALCKQACEKLLSVCFGDGGGGMTSCANSCSMSDAGTSGGTCSNESEMVAAFKACLEKTTCSDLLACMSAAPRCQGGSGGG